jgi:F-type H+-transporting ATPase subunit epsilon
MAELDRDALAAEIRNAEEDLADAKTDEARNRAQQSLDHMRQLADAL